MMTDKEVSVDENAEEEITSDLNSSLSSPPDTCYEASYQNKVLEEEPEEDNKQNEEISNSAIAKCNEDVNAEEKSKTMNIESSVTNFEISTKPKDVLESANPDNNTDQNTSKSKVETKSQDVETSSSDVVINIRDNNEKYVDFDAATKELEDLLHSIINMEDTIMQQTINNNGNSSTQEDSFNEIDLFTDNEDEEKEYSDEIRKVAVTAEEKYLLWNFDDELNGCVICFESSELCDSIYCQQCDQQICFSCLKVHIATRVSQGKIVIECPGNIDCSKKLSDQLISAFTPAKTMAIFVKNKVEAEQNPNIKTCPGCHQVEIRTDEKQKSIPIKCAFCNMTWCFLCHAPWHSGISCSEYQRDIEGAGKKALKYWAKSKVNGSNNAKKCPTCNHYIERITGCDHMTCSKYVMTTISLFNHSIKPS